MTFTAQIDAWIAKSQARTEAVVKTAVQDTINQAQSMVRVDTGFLKNSGQAAIGELPSGVSINPNKDAKLPEWKSSSVTATLLDWDLKSPFYFGWIANYARHRENKDGFMRLAAQNWPQHVNKAVARVKAEIK